MLHRADGMRIPNQFLKATVFVVSIARFADDGSVLEYDFEGTGFLIGLRCKNCAGQSFFYLVADSEGWRSAFRTDVDHDSEVMPISVPN